VIEMVYVKTPATTANIGAGFDCMGLALGLYNELWVEERGGGLVVEGAAECLPSGEDSLVYKTIKRFYEEQARKPVPKGLYIRQRDEIPPTKGLGSSAACIAGGLLAANALSGVNLPKREIINIAAKMEGHPDNSTPAITGGLCVCGFDGVKVEYIKLDSHKLYEGGIKAAVFMPGYVFPTKLARGILPKTYSREDAVFNVSRAALTVAAICSGAYDMLSYAVDDRIHQPYRAPRAPGVGELFAKARECRAAACFLSGAGPAVVVLYSGDSDIDGLRRFAGGLPGGAWGAVTPPFDNDGAVVKREGE
jgi:homoserine kinase